MKILHILPELRKGGAERLAIDICKQLQMHEDVQVKMITFSPDNAYTELTADIDLQVVAAHVQLSLWRKNKAHVQLLQQAIEAFAPDIIHTHLFEAEIVSRSCYYPQAKWFSHCHDNMRQFRNPNIRTLTHKALLTNYYEKRYLYRRYDMNGGNTFIAISHDTEDYFKLHASKYPVILLPNAIDYHRFYAVKTYNFNHKLQLVNVGSYQDKKNQKFLIAIAKVLKRRGVDFELKLLGAGGTNYNNIAKLIVENDLQDHVFQLGNVADVETYYQQAYIYVHSAYYEPLGLVLLEAMAAGLPVVVLDGKGNRDIIVQGKNGYMLYEQNAEAFADIIMEIWTHQQLYRSMSAYAQQYAQQYDIKEYTDKLLEIYAV